MRNILPVAAIGAVVLATAASAAAEMRPIDEVLAIEQSDATRYYVMMRCSAVYVSVAAAITANGDSDAQALVPEAVALSVQFGQFAKLFDERAGGNATLDGIAQQVDKIADIYVDEMNQNYAATGNRFEGIILADMQWCRAVAEESEAIE